MAPSSLPGNFSGFGIFVTRDLRAGESILGAPDGVGIPVSTYHRDGDPNYYPAKKFRRYFYDYVWAHGMPDHVLYDSPPDIVDYQTGMGSLPNHHCVLSHLSSVYPNPPYDDSLASRFKDPGAGAFSYNRGREFVVTRDVEAGEEIFLSYGGYCDPRVRESTSWTSELLMAEDYEAAASIVLRARYDGSASELTFDSATGESRVWPTVDRRVAGLLPQSRDTFRNVVEAADRRGGGHEEVTRQVALHNLNRRSTDWVEHNGICLENLVGRPSTIPGAGHGAFAQRALRSGEIVTPVPLLQIMDKEALKIYNRQGEHVETQLLLNYCFGHPQSSLLLCPNTNAALINSCSHRTKECGPKGPNAEYRWATGWDRSTPSWLNLTLDELAERNGHGLAFEIVATRDIDEGEEVFIDYGVDWERAWQRHVKGWAPPEAPADSLYSNRTRHQRGRRWITAREANDNDGPIIDELVAGDLRDRAEHPYLFTGCQYWETSSDREERYASPNVQWRDLSDDEILAAYSEPGTYYTDNSSGRRLYGKHRDRSHWPCTVLRQENDGMYTVRINRPFFADRVLWDTNQLPRILTNYSRDFIHYFVRPYASDQHLPGVFRHEIGIRDDIFPRQWKNQAGAGVGTKRSQ
jgi:hypothetical protein